MAGEESCLPGDCRIHWRATDVPRSEPVWWRLPYVLSVMQFALVGLSHKTAPIEVRERLAFNGDAVKAALSALVQKDSITEAMILSTCNRVEVVTEGSDDRLIRDFICDYHQISRDDVSKHLYSFKNNDAI